MKVVKKNVYYCDHCSKRGLSGGHMKTHEAHCTNNPKRTCRLCGNNSIEQIVTEFKARFTLIDMMVSDLIFGDEVIYQTEVRWTGEPVTLKEIKESVGECPTCTFAILRQAGFNRYYFETLLERFEYQKELQHFFVSRKPDPSDYYRY